MNRPNRWSLIVTVAVIFGAGLLVGLWLNRQPPAPKPTSTAHYVPTESTEAVVMNVYEQVSPSVVNILATTRSLRWDFWMRLMPPSVGQGSGFVIDNQGHILTNNHVVGNAEKLEVTFEGKKKVPARLIGKDPESDLAVIKVDPFPEMRTAVLGDSEQLRVGQRVVAIGNPFGFQHTVTSGFISALHRDIAVGDRTLIDMIQTDAGINPGNSGGPLINAKSEVIGINTAIFTQGGAFTGIGFAMPIKRAIKAGSQIIEHGRVIYPWLGLRYWINLNPAAAERLGLPPVNGVLIVQLYPGSPAAAAGLKAGDRPATYPNTNIPITIGDRYIFVGGDIILGVDGTSTPTYEEYRNIIRQKSVGDRVTLLLMRGDEEFSVNLTLEADPRTRQW